MKKQIFAGVVVLFATAVSFAQMAEPMEPMITGTADLTYTGKYVWRGFDALGSKSAIHPSIDLFSPSCGFGVNVTGHRANSSGFETFERWDYTLYYLGKMFEGEMHEINYRLAYVYFNFPQQSSHTRGDNPITDPTFTLDCGTYDLHEGHAVLSFPRILGVEGLVPTYVIVKLMPVNSGTVVGANSPSGGTSSGFAHIFMLDYAMPYVCPITGLDRKLNLHAETVFNDGVAPTGVDADHDWSHAVFGASTTYELAENVNLTPGFYYQSSWDDSVNSSDQYWGSLSLTLKF